MRTFVLGTGRCGTKTFNKACEHLVGYTTAHELKTFNNDLTYNDNHIECDCHLFWHLPNLFKLYPDALYIHLIRDKEPCVNSWKRRGTIKAYSAFTEMDEHGRLAPHIIASNYYDFVIGMIDSFFENKECKFIKMSLPPSGQQWKYFHTLLGKPEGYQQSFLEWKVIHNAS
jgi:hypothetical protein